MPKIKSIDGTNLYYEEVGTGTPVVFVHEYAGDYRTWEPQMRYFARSHRCVTYSQRGYPPSDVPSDPARYGQDIARGDVVALMDALGIDKAHVVGHSMGGYTALHVGLRHPQRCISVTAAGCGWGSLPDPAAREAMRKVAVENAKMFTEKSMAEAAAIYGDGAMRHPQKFKDPRGYAEFMRMLAEHSSQGHALTMSMLQAKRPTLWDMEADLKKFSVPLLIVVGDEDESSLDGSVFLKRAAPTSGLLVV
ncbi:MAG: alpha/beta hydrolase, partial [Xanthobacteraceae bacterium]